MCKALCEVGYSVRHAVATRAWQAGSFPSGRRRDERNKVSVSDVDSCWHSRGHSTTPTNQTQF